MNFNFLQSVAVVVSLGAMACLYSCNSDEDLEQDVRLGQKVDNTKQGFSETIELSAEEFDAMVEEVKNDTTVKSYSIYDPNSMNSLKSITDSYEPSSVPFGKKVLTGLRGLRLSGHLRIKDQGLHKDKNDSWYGWYFFDVDLNDGAGGDYLYLAARFLEKEDSYGEYISGLYATTYIPYNQEIVIDSRLDYFNCNAGTKKGGPIYLGVNRGGNSPITAMMIVSRNRKPDYSKSGYNMEPVYDLNKGAGGDYVYIYTKH